MISRVVARKGERMVPQPSAFTGAQQNSEFAARCVVSLEGWRWRGSVSEQWSGYGSRLQIIGSSCFSWNVRGARLAPDARRRRILGAARGLRCRRTTDKKRETRPGCDEPELT